MRISDSPEITPFIGNEKSVETSVVGGKGASLIKLYRANLQVPDGFVVTTEAYKKYWKDGMPSSFKESLLLAFDSLGSKRVAVRSSATSEDSSAASWAGQFESFMNVNRDSLIQSVMDCWDSVKGASAYAETQGLRQEELVVAVVIQEMVDSEVSGVAFSVNPINHAADEIMIEATYGLGELLVQGMVTPDNYIVSKDEGITLKSTIALKTKKLAYQASETKEVPVENDLQKKPCLSDEQLHELTDLICRVEAYYGSPQDIEWALKDSKFYILQARPITA